MKSSRCFMWSVCLRVSIFAYATFAAQALLALPPFGTIFANSSKAVG